MQFNKPLDTLKHYWNYPAFRPFQEDIINDVIAGNDALALMPTGGGKSICFQVPALFMEGICIVVSPLIALMKDQVDNLKQNGIQAEAIFSGMRYQDMDRILDNCIFGNIKLLYLSPERLKTDLAIERIKRMNVNLFAVDEAHCISQWGYDFRPSYLEIAAIRELHPKTPVLALTATATTEVVEDIQERLAFKKKNVFQQSFERKNLAYVVRETENKEKKLLEIVQKIPGSAVVYVRSRKKTKEIAHFLYKNKISADFYNAGLTTVQRSFKQDQWINNKIRIIVATNAFGMGIDKPDVRLVVHMDLPDNLEAYYQEAGRAGRDGKKAYCAMLYNTSDRANLERRYELSYPEFKYIKTVYSALGSYFQLAVGGGAGDSFDFDIVEFSDNFNLKIPLVYSALKILDQSGFIVLTESVFTPSTLKFSIGKEALYDYQLRNKKLDVIIKAILRTYQGAFNNYVNFREIQLANFLKISTKEFRGYLFKMQKDGLIYYRPQKDKPQIIFMEERIDPANLAIDQANYNFRKKRHKARMEKTLDYAEKDICRSVQLLEYFAEANAKPCGQCDVCIAKKNEVTIESEFDRLKAKIYQLLKREDLNIEELVDSFGPKRKEVVLETISYLIDEGVISVENELLSWNE